MLICLVRQALPSSPSDGENNVHGDEAVIQQWTVRLGLGPRAVSHPSESRTVLATALRLYTHGPHSWTQASSPPLTSCMTPPKFLDVSESVSSFANWREYQKLSPGSSEVFENLYEASYQATSPGWGYPLYPICSQEAPPWPTSFQTQLSASRGGPSYIGNSKLCS